MPQVRVQGLVKIGAVSFGLPAQLQGISELLELARVLVHRDLLARMVVEDHTLPVLAHCLPGLRQPLVSL